MEPDISVVIPTYNRIALLREALAALLDQSLDPARYEIIVVDDGSRDGTRDWLADLARQFPARVRHFAQEHQLAGSARNLGIEQAKADLVLLMDSDVLPCRRFVESHLELHRSHPEPEVAVLGRLITADDAVDLLDPDERAVIASGHTRHGAPIVDIGAIQTASLSLKRDCLIQAGLFTPGLPCLQDMELGFRLKERGVILLYSADAIGVHRNPLDTLDKVIASGRKYGKTLAEWYTRVPLFKQERIRLGARFNGGWPHFRTAPWSYAKDAIRRWCVNRWTIGPLVALARRQPITRPPSRRLVRCCQEIWAYHYRAEFRNNLPK